MRVRQIIRLLAVPFGLAAVCGLVCLCCPVDIRTSLDDLIGGAGNGLHPALRMRSSGLVPVIVSAPDAQQAKSAADALADAFGQAMGEEGAVKTFCRTIRYRYEGEAVTRIMDFCLTHRSGLASPEAVERLKTPEGRRTLARHAARRYGASPVPPLFPPTEDPFCLLDGFVTSLPTSYAGWFPKNGVLTAERAGVCHVLMLLELNRTVVEDIDALTRFKRSLDASVASVTSGRTVSISACGAPLHTAMTAGACKREIGWLTWFSLLFIAALSVVAFRSLRWIPLLALSLAVAVLSGLATLLVAFGGLHLMTVVMGTTVLGLVIDYSFHWLLHPAKERRETVRNLLVSFVTTEISLLPLMFSSVPVLRQSAVFLGAGLAAALGYVVFCYPPAPTVPSDGISSRPFALLRPLVVVVGLLALFGLFSVRFGTDMTAVYRPPDELLSPERLFAELNGGADGSRGFIVTEGASLDALLTRERSLALPPDVPCLSRFLPPLAERLRVAEDVRRLFAEQGKKMAQLFGVDDLPSPPEPAAWRLTDLPEDLKDNFVAGSSLVIASAPRPDVLPDGVIFCQPRKLIADALSSWAGETRLRLGIALLLMFVALAAFCRRRAVAVFFPSVFALLTVAGLLGLSGVPINLFHLLAGFLLAGMSVDYTVFLHAGKSLKPALCSLLTSMAGFGALVFVSFPVVKSFGAVLGIGLPVSFAVALATMPRPQTVERGASPVGLEILWLFYRAFGLRVLHVAAAGVGVCVWLCSRSVRRASPSLAKLVNFTRSLADKLVVMAEGDDLPKVAAEESADASEFLANVRDGKGVFILSSHCGTIETLVGLGDCKSTFHAWMDFDRTSVFNRFYLRHARRKRVVIHPISEIGMETAFFAGDALDRGDCLVMAGDRGRGAFRFAHALGHPVYFVACVRVGTAYRAIVRRLPSSTDEMERRFAEALDVMVAAFPLQSFTWEK